MLRRRSHASSATQVRRFKPGRVESLEPRTLLSTFTVTSTLDSGPTTLRQAILDANASPGGDLIAFAIGGGHQTITLTAPLPTVTDTTTIDGSTQPGFVATPLVEIDGNGQATDLLHVTAPDTIVKGLVINHLDPNAGSAIWVDGPNFHLQGCFIGTDASGTAASPVHYGLVIDAAGSHATIGGTGANQGNLLSGSFSGILANDNFGTVIQGNKIGTDVTGTFPIPNNVGLDIRGSDGTAPPDILIGGTTAGAGNLISGNSVIGIQSEGGATIQGNKIGTNFDGTVAIPNLRGLTNRGGLIGGTVTGAGNLISGNTREGISVGDHNLIQGNYIGTDVTASHALGNGFGIQTSFSTIGGTTAEARNIISGNSYGLSNCFSCLIQGNSIGTDRTGELAIGNTAGLMGGDSNTVGGTIVGAGNLISGNNQGVRFCPNSVFQGNFIGTNKEGNASIYNQYGFYIDSGVTNVTIGGTSPGAGNLISGNGGAILFHGNGVSEVKNFVIQGNKIGTDASGTAPLGNDYGVLLVNGASAVLIGGTTPGAGNIIAFNYIGVRLEDNAQGLNADGSGISILGNSIYGSTGAGISIAEGNTTAGHVNDPGDADTGPNGGQNYPVLTAAGTGGCVTTVAGTLNSNPNATFRIELFASAVGDPSGYGQGTRYLGYVNVTTNNSGNATFSTTPVGAFAVGEAITATATAPDGSTSEFSAWLKAILLNHPPVAALAGPKLAVPYQPRTYTLSATDVDACDPPDGFTYIVNFGDGTASQTIAASANNGTGVSLDHVFATTGTYTITLTATDQHGAVSPAVTQVVTVQAAQLQPDPAHPGQSILAVGGTSGNDCILFLPDCSGKIDADLNSHVLGSYVTSSVSRIVAYGGPGDDSIIVFPTITLPSDLFGGDGDDFLVGGGGNNVLVGGAGDDYLIGGTRRNLIIGGDGNDVLLGTGGDDVLIGGSTAFDQNLVALDAVMAEWTSTDSYATRVADLAGTGTGSSFAARRNGNTFLTTSGSSATVFVDDASDLIVGGEGMDWFFADLTANDPDRDTVIGKRKNEVISQNG